MVMRISPWVRKSKRLLRKPENTIAKRRAFFNFYFYKDEIKSIMRKRRWANGSGLTGAPNDKKIVHFYLRRRIPLFKNARRTLVAVGLALSLSLFGHAFALDDGAAVLRGRVFDQNEIPIGMAVIKLVRKDFPVVYSSVSDEAGRFSFCAVPPGRYRVRIESPALDSETHDILWVEPGADLLIKIKLPAPDLEASPGSKMSLIVLSPLSTQTTISSDQIERLPSGNSVWSLVENQDLSATTNRIDVGGLWETLPVLFSGRGSCSWTQNNYLLNGMNVTDPYWTGQPLFIPDVFSLSATQMSNAAHPPQNFSPGAYYSLIPKEGTPDFHGGVSAFYIDKRMTSSNISDSLQNEGLLASHTFRHLADFNLHLSGPLIGQKLLFFMSLTSQAVSRNLAAYEREDPSYLYSGLVHVSYLLPKHTLRFLWTGQAVSNASFGAGRDIPFASTSRQRDSFEIVQVILDSRANPNHSYRAGLSAALSDLDTNFQSGSQGPHKLEIFKKIPSGPAASADRDSHQTLSMFFDGKSLLPNFLGTQHLLQFGFQAQFRSARSRREIMDNMHLLFFNGEPLEVVLFNGPFEHKESALQTNVFAQETVTLSYPISAYAGVNLGWSRGSNPSYKIQWLNVSPRFGLSLPLSQEKTSMFKVSAARYYFDLPLNYMAYGNPGAPGGLAYRWTDTNGDGNYQESEKGALLRREGPLFAAIDAGIKQPFTDEYVLSFIHDFGAHWFFSLAGFYRETRNLIETENTGVLLSDYDPIPFYDEGDDRIAHTHDDLFFTIYNQKEESLGRDFFLLTNPEGKTRVSRYKGLDLTLVKKYSDQWLFFLSLTAMQAVGTTSPGNTEWENDDGVIGALYDNPNAAINARGRLRFDRAYTARIGLSVRAPFGTRIGTLIKYYDGQPFARKIIVTGLNQGPFYIQAHPRGVSRYEYNMTVDIRLEKIIRLGVGRLRILIDVFNLFNRNLATAENEWTGPEFPGRYATEIQSPRVFRLGLNYEF
jgi:hypothetical protein